MVLRRPSNPPFTIEIRNIANDGSVSFESQQYQDWDPPLIIAGLRQHTRDTIYFFIYADGVDYCFSHSGHVYALAPNVNNFPPIYVFEWNWSGDPHKFPHFDFSKIYHQTVHDG